MNIEDKLVLVEKSKNVVGIKVEMFVRFYEQSPLDGNNGYPDKSSYRH
ncbi:hypothetical protein [Vibrio mediterranei]|nr:hypothetical protein [Vibrio mediterranei]MCG9661058.1 hypothetical protein [Vibrio mediterranei]